MIRRVVFWFSRKQQSKLYLRISLFVILPALVACERNHVSPPSTEPQASPQKVVVYSARSDHLIAPVFRQFTQDTGIEVDYLTDSAGPLLARLRSEGANTPADVLLTVDAGNLWHAQQTGMLRTLDSTILRQEVPQYLRDPQGYWYGLSQRARVIVYHKDRVSSDSLSNYANLAEKDWHDRLCLRTSKKVYNQSLVASLLVRYGPMRTEEIVRGWVANLALPPFSSDTKVLHALIAGNCDITIVNTYYVARLEAEWQKAGKVFPLRVYLPTSPSNRPHVNISGAGITKHAKQPELARRLLEWLISPHAQQMFALANQEYPVRKGVPISPILMQWGPLHASVASVANFGSLQKPSTMLMERAGYR